LLLFHLSTFPACTMRGPGVGVSQPIRDFGVQ